MKNKKKKGFTLIELIVVIAILGILAAIAIPRLGGFTDKAKTSADNELVAVIRNSTAALIADGSIKGSGNIVVTVAGGALVYTPAATLTNSAGVALNAAGTKALLDPLVGTTKVYRIITTATITVAANGEVTSTP